MKEDAQELKNRITQLSDEQLLEMVTAESGDYRQEALDYAKAELTTRGIDFTESPAEVPPSNDELRAVPLSAVASLVAHGSTCPICGGPLRAGTLVAEKELTIIFSDNHEERFVKVNACRQCGQVSIVADFDTDVQP